MIISRKSRDRARRALVGSVRDYSDVVTAWIVAIAATAVGALLTLGAPLNLGSFDTIGAVQEWAPFHAWGVGFLFFSLWGIAALGTRSGQTLLPFGFLALYTGLFCLPIFVQMLKALASPVSIWFIMALAAISFVAGSSVELNHDLRVAARLAREAKKDAVQ